VVDESIALGGIVVGRDVESVGRRVGERNAAIDRIAAVLNEQCSRGGHLDQAGRVGRALRLGSEKIAEEPAQAFLQRRIGIGTAPQAEVGGRRRSTMARAWWGSGG